MPHHDIGDFVQLLQQRVLEWLLPWKHASEVALRLVQVMDPPWEQVRV